MDTVNNVLGGGRHHEGVERRNRQMLQEASPTLMGVPGDTISRCGSKRGRWENGGKGSRGFDKKCGRLQKGR